MKKKIFYIAAIVICLAILSGGTLAYYNASDTARNVITSGKVELVLLEQQRVGDQVTPYPAQPVSVMPGKTVSKIVSVRNDAQPAWIRVSYTVTVYDADGNKKEIPAEEQDAAIIIEPDSTNWFYRDGWWYYSAALATGETTRPLFDEVRFSATNMDNQYQRCSIVIDVTAQGVQRANNGETALEALGWPES